MSEISEYINGVVLLIGFTILYFTTKNLLPSYFSEKGKNLANKKDISELTSKVEEVKIEFAERLQHLKSKLDVKSQNELNFKNDTRQVVLSCHQKLDLLHQHLSDTFNQPSNYYNQTEITDRVEKTRLFAQDFARSHSIFDLYVEDDKLLDDFRKVRKSYIDLTNVVISGLVSLERNLEKRDLQDFKAEHDEIYEIYRKLSFESTSECHNSTADYRGRLRSYLRELYN
ncbi:hypothetical protein [Fulvivirga sp.]|uniref:hypothetical protein n=1 Tax=Fulvivirga sp. TaxID=1931237 RepID=UPI0032F06392